MLLGALFFYGGQNWLETEEISVSSPRLPAAFQGLRIVQISDLHGKEFAPGNRELLEQTAALAPDLIAITGDLIDAPEQFSMLEPLIRGLVAIAPTYYVTGNHEWAIREAYTVKAALRGWGATPLSNEYVVLEREGAVLALAGIDDPNGPYDQKTPEQLMEELRGELGEVYTVLLAHRNDRYETYDRCGWDLTLCGHAHGGLIRLPFTDGLVDNSRGGFFPTHTAGLYPLPGGGAQVVSRGLGNSGGTLRLFNRPHLVCVELT